MKHCYAVLMIALVAISGCTSARQSTGSEATDGFYVESSKNPTDLVVRLSHPVDGRILTIPVKPFDAFLPEHIVVFDTPEGSYVQISGRATVDEWSQQPIILVANNKPYIELSKSGQAVSGAGVPVGPSATISLVVSTRAEADTAAAALRQRFAISL